MTTFVSLFRGINVGGHQMVRMDALKELYASLGFKDIVTYIQSGNVVFSAQGTDTATLSAAMAAAIGEKLGIGVGVVVIERPIRPGRYRSRFCTVHAHVKVARDPLGRKLNRRQRILDLMRDSLSYFAPRRGALSRQQFRKVFDHQHDAAALA